MNGRLKAAIAFFAVITLLEIGDLVGLIMTLIEPEPIAAMLGITVQVQRLRAVVFLLLAGQAALGSAIALYGLLRHQWQVFRLGTMFGAVGLLLYGVFQIISTAIWLQSLPFILVGGLYIGLGILAIWFGRSPVAAKTDVPKPTT
jgi:hypothetical protein